MAKAIRIRNAILCDYVSRGENNKHILLNVYSGDVLFSQFPPVAVFGLYVEYVIDTEEMTNVTFEVRSNGDRIIEGLSEFSPLSGDRYGVLALQQFPLTLGGDTTLEVWLSAPGYRSVMALQKNIKMLTQSAFASATKPPASRSRSARKAKAKQL